nr:MAG: helix-turn-helix domain protein [Bacteriophage sp.]
MRLAYKFNIGNNENISSQCKIRNDLYNQALYIFRETLAKEDKWLSYFKLDAIMKNTKNLDGDINYRLLKAQCSQQVLRILDKNIKSYYKSVQDYKKNILISIRKNQVFLITGREVLSLICITRVRVAK